MCLTSRRRISRKAKRDITVWKVVVNGWHAPLHYMFVYKKDNRCEEFQKVAPMSNRFACSWWFQIYQGFHSYDNKEDAEAMLNWFNDKELFRNNVAHIVKAVIPKGSRYYRGMDNDYCSEYLSFPDYPNLN